MKVILQKPVDKLGAPGDVVDVADGYARNFLIPRGMAMAASKGAVRHAGRLKQAHTKRVEQAVTEARALAGRLAAAPLQIPSRAGEDGRLFGSVTVVDVADAIERTAGVTVDRKRIHLPEPIRSVGTHDVTVHLHPDVDASVTVEVVATT
jgi:large subunit ribosomal protein L9